MTWNKFLSELVIYETFGVIVMIYMYICDADNAEFNFSDFTMFSTTVQIPILCNNYSNDSISIILQTTKIKKHFWKFNILNNVRRL